jgi:hypothetical protein
MLHVQVRLEKKHKSMQKEQHDQDEDEEEVCGQLQHQSCTQGTNIM